MTAPMSWPAEAIRASIDPRVEGFHIEVVPEIDSTNAELMRRARAGQRDPVLLVAESQTAGRGRLGRPWRGPRGAALMFSLGLPLAPVQWLGLSLAVGLSIAESLHPAVGLKWPNDLWWKDRKLGGILVETASIGTTRQVVIGVGLNITPVDGAGLATPPAALDALLPGVDAPQALLRLAGPLTHAVKTFETTGFAPLVERFDRRDVLRGRMVWTSDGLQGTAMGVDSTGALQVRSVTGLHHVTSAEISVRPLDAERS